MSSAQEVARITNIDELVENGFAIAVRYPGEPIMNIVYAVDPELLINVTDNRVFLDVAQQVKEMDGCDDHVYLILDAQVVSNASIMNAKTFISKDHEDKDAEFNIVYVQKSQKTEEFFANLHRGGLIPLDGPRDIWAENEKALNNQKEDSND